MIRLGFAFLLCLVGSTCFGVGVSKRWDRLFGGNPGTDSRVVDAVSAADGSVYALIGLNQGTAAQQDVVVSRFSASGVLVWTSTLADLGNRNDLPQRIALVPLRSGGTALVYTAIRFLADGSSQLDVRRLNPTTGATIWSRSLPGFSEARVLETHPQGVADFDSNRDYFLVGGSQIGPLGGSDAVVYRFHVDGPLLAEGRWNRYSLGKAAVVGLQVQAEGLAGAVSFQRFGSAQGPFGGLGLVRWSVGRTSLVAERSSILGESDMMFGGIDGRSRIAVASNDPRTSASLLSVFNSDLILLWDFAYSYRGLGAHPVGMHAGTDIQTSWRMVSNNRTASGQAVVITTWRDSMFPLPAQTFEEEGVEFEAQSIASTKPGTVVAGRTLADPDGWWILRHATGAPAFWFRESQPLNVAKVVPAYRGYLVLGEQRAANGSTVGRLTHLGLNLSSTALSIIPSTTPGGTTATATVVIEEEAPLGGVSFQVFSDNANVRVPSTVTVAQGRTSAQFLIETLGVSSLVTANIRVGKGASARTATLRVRPADVSSLTLLPTEPGAQLFGGETFRLRIRLDGVAPAGGSRVAIFNGGSLGLPAEAIVPAGRGEVEVPGTALQTSIAREFNVSARIVRTISRTVRVEAPVLSRIDAPAGVRGGTSVPVRLYLRGKSNVPLNATYVPSSTLTSAVVIPVPAGALEATASIPTRDTHAVANGTFRYLASERPLVIGLLRRSPARLTLTPDRPRETDLVTVRIELLRPSPGSIRFRVQGGGWNEEVRFATGDQVKELRLPVPPERSSNIIRVWLLEDGVPHDTKLLTIVF